MAVPQTTGHTHNPRRDVAMPNDKSKIPLEPVIVETYKFGGSTVHIGSNYFAQTPEEVQRVLDNFQAVGWKIVRKIHENGGAI